MAMPQTPEQRNTPLLITPLRLTSPELDNGGEDPIGLAKISPVAELQVINYKRLAANDLGEAEKLFRACQTDGFFYLDLDNPDDQIALNSVDDVYALAKALFALDEAEKLKYDVDKLGEMKLNGYTFLNSLLRPVTSVVSMSANAVPDAIATSLVAATSVVSSSFMCLDKS